MTQDQEHMQRLLSEPKPVWEDAPRYAPDAPFPPYRFVHGLNHHPTESAEGHAFAKGGAPAPLHPWRHCRDYLFGIDLYHNGYFWESHEAWEGLWRTLPGEAVERAILQALIFNSAAQIKAHASIPRGTTIHSLRAHAILESLDPGMDVELRLGLDLVQFKADIERHYRALWDNDEAAPEGLAPRLQVTL